MDDRVGAARHVLKHLSAEAFVAMLSIEEQNKLRTALDHHGPILGQWVIPGNGGLFTGDLPGTIHFNAMSFSGAEHPIVVQVRHFKKTP